LIISKTLVALRESAVQALAAFAALRARIYKLGSLV